MKTYTICFYCMSSNQHILKLRCLPLVFISYKTIFKKGVELVFLPHFLHNFDRKLFLTLYSISSQNFIDWFFLLLEILSNMCIIIIYFPIDDVIRFETNLSFVTKSLFYITKNVRTQCNILKTKRAVAEM